MGFLTDLIPISDIVKKYIRKLIINQASQFNHNTEEIDMIVRLHKNEIVIITWSLRYRRVLNVLNNNEVEQILKS